MALPPKAELQWWYQFYFATERGRAGYEKYRHDFAKLIWQLASPQWNFDDATFDRSAAAFDNPDHVAIVVAQLSLAARHSPTANRNMTISTSGSPQARTLPCRPSRSKAMPMARRTPRPAHTPRSFQVGTSIVWSPVASDTTCLRKRHGPSPKPSPTSM